MKHIFLLLIIPFFFLRVAGQGNIRDSSLTLAHIAVTYGAYLPGGHLSDRFGWNSGVGLVADVKLKSHWIAGLSGSFLFGNQIKENVLSNLYNSQGYIIDMNGRISTVLQYERGWLAELYGGYQLPVMGPNPNSGIFFNLGGGYMQHKIKIEHRDYYIPQLEGEYLAGYDRLTSGFFIHQLVGFRYLSNRRFINFFAAAEIYEGFTMSRRSYNFNTMESDKKQRLDLLFGFKVGWVFPLYARAPKDIYY